MQENDLRNPADPRFWRERWQHGQTGWDLGGPHPFLIHCFTNLQTEGLLAEGAHVWVPGCGRGHCAATLAERGFHVWATDLTPEAVDAARDLYADLPTLDLEVGDALALPAERQQTFDVVFDRAVLCAIGPEQRQAFAASVLAALRPGGLFVTFAFTKTAREDGLAGPPFGISLTELHHLFNAGCSLVSIQERAGASVYGAGNAGPIVSEATIVFRRREVAHA